MTNADLLPAAVLKRKAVVYVRQSPQAQVNTNHESQRRQYELVDVARSRGFRDIGVKVSSEGGLASDSITLIKKTSAVGNFALDTGQPVGTLNGPV
jgi:hypothetical protein